MIGIYWSKSIQMQDFGLGESGAWGYLEASQAAIEKFGRYLVGKDPLKIEHHWQYMYGFSFQRLCDYGSIKRD